MLCYKKDYLLQKGLSLLQKDYLCYNMDYLSLNHPHKTKILTWLIHKIKIALNLKRKTRQERNVKHRRIGRWREGFVTLLSPHVHST